MLSGSIIANTLYISGFGFTLSAATSSAPGDTTVLRHGYVRIRVLESTRSTLGIPRQHEVLHATQDDTRRNLSS